MLKIDNEEVQVLATSGDTHLGGENFDNKILEYLLKKFDKKIGKNADISEKFAKAKN